MDQVEGRETCYRNFPMANNESWWADEAVLLYCPAAKIWGFQPGCPAFLEAHNLLNSLIALMTNGTPTGPSNGR